jgi:hypothetical protein
MNRPNREAQANGGTADTGIITSLQVCILVDRDGGV